MADSKIHALILPDGIESRLPGYKGPASGRYVARKLEFGFFDLVPEIILSYHLLVLSNSFRKDRKSLCEDPWAIASCKDLPDSSSNWTITSVPQMLFVGALPNIWRISCQTFI